MKNFHQNLLIVLALSLCGLCAWQWNFQTVQRGHLEEQNKKIFDRETEIQGYTNSIYTMDAQIAQLSERITELKQTISSNEVRLIVAERDAAKLNATNDLLTAEVTQYRSALTNLEARLTTAYDGITKQNEAVSNLVAQRDEFIGKYTNSVVQYNGLVIKYNEAVDRLNKLQGAATNGDAK